jgi:8-oxo-dGTP pyrophosphatase MutT (NUDIX family)
VVTALLVPPLALGSCSPTGGGDGVDPHPFDCQVLLIRRAEHGRHGGQIALPGGELEGGETPQETAIRELHEELGFHAADPEHEIRFVGSLDPAYVPASNFLVQVLIAVAPQTPHITPDPREVAETLGAELGLFDPRHSVHVVDAEEQGQRLRYGVIPVPGERRVWGLTARLLCELASRLAQV